MDLAESWLRMIPVRTGVERTAEQKFDSELDAKDTHQKRSDSSN
jgi:hypothetical protein